MKTESEMRAENVPYLNTELELLDYINSLVDRQHDYGTCVYAMSMSAVAALNYVAWKLGVTGFQASCADLDILRRTRGLEWGSLQDYSRPLYPQYCTAEHFPSFADLMARPKVREELRKRATELLNESSGVACEEVVKHWKMLASTDEGEACQPH